MSFLALVLAAALQDGRPPVFQDLGLEAALERGRVEAKLVLLDATAPWCGPCRRMDATTWVAPEVVAWCGANAVVVQLDLDADRALNERLGIDAYPTLVAFRDGAEVDRVVGALDAQALVGWLQELAAGRRFADVARDRAAAALESGDWNACADSLEELVALREDDVATLLMVRLFDDVVAVPEGTAPEDATRLVHERRARLHEALRHPLRALVTRSDLAHANALPLRDHRTPDQATTIPSEELRDWIELNWILDEDRRTARWVALRTNLEDGLAYLAPLRRRLFEPLVENNRARVAGELFPDLLEDLRSRRVDVTAYDALGGPSGATAGGLEQPADRDQPRTLPAIPLAPAPAVPAVPAVPGVPAHPGGPDHGAGLVNGSHVAEDRPPPRDDAREEVRARLAEAFVQRAARVYGVLLAADRDEDATEAQALALEVADTPRTRALLLEWALRSGSIARARARHLTWLQELGQR